MEAVKFHDLHSESASWKTRRANGVVAVQQPADVKPRKSQSFCLDLKAVKKPVFQLKGHQQEGSLTPGIVRLCSIQNFN
jgi:hypothetical protein